MADPRLFRLRVTFAKQGRLVLLSHLELCRALERAVRRAQLPYAVSQGFSPHMRIAFGAALPVGVGGEHEFFDLYLTNYVAPQKCLEALRAAIADDLMVQTCEYVEHREPAASVAFPLCAYRAVLSADVDDVVVPELIKVVRKKKEKELRVAEFLRDNVKVTSEGGQAVLAFTLEAKPTGSLRPDLLVAECIRATVEAGKAPADLCVASLTRVAQQAL